MQPLQNPNDEVHVPTIVSGSVSDPEQFALPVITMCVISMIEVVTVDKDDGEEAIELARVMQTSNATHPGGQGINDLVEYYSVTREVKNAIFGKVYHALKLELVPAADAPVEGLPHPPPYDWRGGGAYRLREVVPHIEVAIKAYFKQQLRAMSGRSAEDHLAEFGAMQYLGRNNRYVMGQLGAYHDGECVYSVMEFCSGGELHDLVAVSAFPEDKAHKYFLQILTGLEYCHSMGVAHRDMSLENIIYDDRTDTMKIIDFGMCLKVPKDETTGAFMLMPPQGRCGKKNYMSPEVIKNTQNFNPMKADIWALGVILHTILTGFPPVDCATTADPRYRMLSAGHLRTLLSYWNVTHLSDSAMDLLENILRPTPGDRLTLAQIRQHPWCVLGPGQRAGGHVEQTGGVTENGNEGVGVNHAMDMA
jgi:serine/threonine protein kinase